jgi:hypothetical protein
MIKLATLGLSIGAGAILTCLLISEGIMHLCEWRD